MVHAFLKPEIKNLGQWWNFEFYTYFGLKNKSCLIDAIFFSRAISESIRIFKLNKDREEENLN